MFAFMFYVCSFDCKKKNTSLKKNRFSKSICNKMYGSFLSKFIIIILHFNIGFINLVFSLHV